MRNKTAKRLRKEARAETEGQPGVCYERHYHDQWSLSVLLGGCTRRDHKDLKRVYANR